MDVEPISKHGRARWIGWWLLSCAMIAAVSVALGSLITSPWQEAAENVEQAVEVTAPVEMREFLTESQNAEGTVSLGEEITVPLSSAEGAESATVTAVHVQAGQVLQSGDAVVDISGRPVIALQLSFPPYRDLTPGMSGPDVEQLQQALSALGLDVGHPDGNYGSRTSAAVRALYSGLGLEPPIADAGLIELATAAQRAAEDADTAWQRAQVAATAGGAQDGEAADPGAGTSAELLADAALARQRARADAEAAAADADTPLPMSEIVRITQASATVSAVAEVGVVATEDTGQAAALRSGVGFALVRATVANVEAFEAGQAVTVTAATDSTRRVEGQVATVGEFSSSSLASDLPGYEIRIDLGTVDLPFSDGESVLGAVVTDTAGVIGLSVPLTSIRSDSDGEYVVKKDPTGGSVEVAVTVETTQDGYAQVSADDLYEGDEVLVAGIP